MFRSWCFIFVMQNEPIKRHQHFLLTDDCTLTDEHTLNRSLKYIFKDGNVLCNYFRYIFQKHWDGSEAQVNLHELRIQACQC